MTIRTTVHSRQQMAQRGISASAAFSAVHHGHHMHSDSESETYHGNGIYVVLANPDNSGCRAIITVYRRGRHRRRYN